MSFTVPCRGYGAFLSACGGGIYGGPCANYRTGSGCNPGCIASVSIFGSLSDAAVESPLGNHAVIGRRSPSRGTQISRWGYSLASVGVYSAVIPPFRRGCQLVPITLRRGESGEEKKQ